MAAPPTESNSTAGPALVGQPNPTSQQAEPGAPAAEQHVSAARDEGRWARPVEQLSVSMVPKGATAYNVAGRRVVGPLQGFGQMWQKTYRVRLTGVSASPEEVIAAWKAHFPEYWPAKNRFYGPICGIQPGEIALLDLSMPGGLRLSTGVLVLYADDESFTLMTPEGHMFAGWITFSAYDSEGSTMAQAQILMRAQDPLTEVGLIFGGHRAENRFWEHTLRSLAHSQGVDAPVETTVVRVDSSRQWSRAGNIRHNAAIRTSLYRAAAPVRWAIRPFRRPGR